MDKNTAKQMAKMVDAVQPHCEETTVAAMPCSHAGAMRSFLFSKLLGGMGSGSKTGHLPNSVFIDGEGGMRWVVSLTWMLVLFLVVGCATSPAPAPTDTTSAGDKPEWDLVLFSDSSGWGVADRYAAHIEADLHVTVKVHDLSGPGLSAGTVLAALRGEEGGRPLPANVPDLIREAEVVVVYGNPLESISESHPGDWNCVSSEEPYARDCAPETFDTYRAHLGAIYEQVLALRGDAPVLVRAFDAYNPLYSVYRERGVYDECVACWENCNEAIHEAAAAHNVPVARVFDAFNGPDHDEDPRDKGYIRDDGEHTTPEGRQVIADLLRELGYGESH
jgi:hypothetical protein